MAKKNDKSKNPVSLPSIDTIKNEKALFFALDNHDTIVFADNAVFRFLEKKKEEVIGHTIQEFLHDYLLGNLKKQEMSFVEFAGSYKKSHVDLDFLPSKTGERKTLHCEFMQYREFQSLGWEMVIIGRDAGTFKQIERLLEIMQETSKTILSSSFDMTIRLDADRKITSLNTACEKHMNCPKAELIGKDISSIIPRGKDKETIIKAFDQASAFHNVSNLKIDIQVNSKIIPSLVNVTALSDSFNNDIGYALVIHSIEEEIKMGSVLKRLEAIDKINALGELAVGISHQTKNYINSISTGLLLLENDISNGFSGSANYENGALSHLAVVKNNLAKLTWLTKHLLHFAPINTPPMDSPGDVNDVLKSLHSLVSDIVRKHKANIYLQLTDSLPTLYFSPIHLEQALLNIVNNAIDALPLKEGKIILSTFLSEDEKWVSITIEDNGSGIPEENLHKIFDIFETTKPVGKGTGLGLYVAQQVVSLLKGTIKVKSKVGEGSTFIIRLPVPEKK